MPRLRRRRPAEGGMERVPDDLPRSGLFTEPVRVDRITVRDPEPRPDGTRVAFAVRVRDADDRRCPDLAVDARIVGPHRSGTGMATTDLSGRAVFRMTGPAGHYRLTVLDVAAGGLAFDRQASRLEAEATIGCAGT